VDDDGHGLSANVVEDVMSTLRLVPRWKLATGEWDEVLGSLNRLRIAMDRGDEAEVLSALDRIERLGPTRLASIAASASSGSGLEPRLPPQPVIEILNTLVHPAGGWAEPRHGEDPLA
jgi:hypothetical protein